MTHQELTFWFLIVWVIIEAAVIVMVMKIDKIKSLEIKYKSNEISDLKIRIQISEDILEERRWKVIEKDGYPTDSKRFVIIKLQEGPRTARWMVRLKQWDVEGESFSRSREYKPKEWRYI